VQGRQVPTLKRKLEDAEKVREEKEPAWLQVAMPKKTKPNQKRGQAELGNKKLNQNSPHERDNREGS